MARLAAQLEGVRLTLHPAYGMDVGRCLSTPCEAPFLIFGAPAEAVDGCFLENNRLPPTLEPDKPIAAPTSTMVTFFAGAKPTPTECGSASLQCSSAWGSLTESNVLGTCLGCRRHPSRHVSEAARQQTYEGVEAPTGRP